MTTKKDVFGMGSMEAMISKMFRKVDNIVWDMTTNSIGMIQDALNNIVEMFVLDHVNCVAYHVTNKSIRI